MEKNMGLVDRILRIAFALVILGLYLAHQLSGTLLIILAVVAAIWFLVGVIGICPLYIPFGIKTFRKNKPK